MNSTPRQRRSSGPSPVSGVKGAVILAEVWGRIDAAKAADAAPFFLAPAAMSALTNFRGCSCTRLPVILNNVLRISGGGRLSDWDLLGAGEVG